MPKIVLELKANLENLTDLRPVGEDFRWYIKVKCTACGETSEHWQYVSQQESEEIKGGRGTANFVLKCKLCSRPASINILTDTISKYSGDKNGEWQPIIAFDCRGVEPVDFDPRIGWAAVGSESETSFDDINLSEKEWADYDEKSSCAVGIYELEHRFVKA